MNIHSFSTGFEQGAQSIARFRIEQAVVAGFEALFAADSQRSLARWFSNDAKLINHCPLHLTCFGGPHRGPESIVRSFQLFLAEFVPSCPNVSNILTDGKHIAFSYSIHLRHVGTGRSGTLTGMSHVTFGRHFRIVRMENFCDTAALAEIGCWLEEFMARSDAIDHISRFRRQETAQTPDLWDHCA